MFHKAVHLDFGKGTLLILTFQDGIKKEYDVARLFQKYPQMQVLKDRSLFLQGKLMGGYGIIWNDDLDLEAETVYQSGVSVGKAKFTVNESLANALLAARAKANLSQAQLAALTGIHQGDISKIERGIGNPSLSTLNRLAEGLGAQLTVSFSAKEAG